MGIEQFNISVAAQWNRVHLFAICPQKCPQKTQDGIGSHWIASDSLKPLHYLLQNRRYL